MYFFALYSLGIPTPPRVRYRVSVDTCVHSAPEMRFLMVYALLRCHVRNILKRGAFWRPSGPDTPERFTPRATWSSLELTRVGDHCGPGRHQEFFFGPTKRHGIRPGVAGGRGAATMARGALKTGDIALLHFFTCTRPCTYTYIHMHTYIHVTDRIVKPYKWKKMEKSLASSVSPQTGMDFPVVQL